MEKGSFGRRASEFTATLADDVQFTWTMMEDERIRNPGRRQLAGALSYILTQLDLIPDHEKAGAVDDAMVVRVAWGLCAEHADKVGTGDAQQIARLTRDEEEISQFLGEALFGKLRRYVIDLAEKTVRGRTADQLLIDAKARG